MFTIGTSSNITYKTIPINQLKTSESVMVNSKKNIIYQIKEVNSSRILLRPKMKLVLNSTKTNKKNISKEKTTLL